MLSIGLSLSFPVPVISPSSCFLCSPRVVVSMRQRCLQYWQVLFLPPSVINSPSTSSLGCDALCIVISFLVLWFICLSSLVHFTKGPEYLTSGTANGYLSMAVLFSSIEATLIEEQQ